MFSYAAGEPLPVSQHKIVLRREALKRWPFLTPLDLSMISSERQLASVVKDHTGGQRAAVASIVHRWVAQHRFRAPPEKPAASLSAWENVGGATKQSGHRLRGTIGIRP